MKKHLLIPLLLVLALSGCGTYVRVVFASKEQDREAKKFLVSSQKSNIYIYQVGYISPTLVFVNGQSVGFVRDQEFMKLELSPGTYDVCFSVADYFEYCKKEHSHIELSTDAGRNYFVKFDSSYVSNQTPNSIKKESNVRDQLSKFNLVALQEGSIDSVEFETKKQAMQRQQAARQPNFASPDKLKAPRPISNNSGKYMSPFTASGALTSWAQEPKTEMDNGSGIAASAGGAVGQHVANKALDFVPFGLGGMIGRSAGESAGRAATRKVIEPALPSAEIIQSSSDLSFKTLDELAVYIYVKNSAHPQYARVLALTQKVYPELQQTYNAAIEKASGKRTSAKQESSPKERLKALQKLKDDGLISEADYKEKKE